MKKNLAGQLGTLIIAASLLSPAAIAGPIQQSSTPPPSQQPQTPTPQPEQTPPSAQTPPPSGQQPPVSQTSKPDESTAQDQSAPGTGDKNPDTLPIQQMPTDPNVKAGSKQDVNAIGNRSVGHGLNFYSLEHEIALGKQLSQEVEKQAKFINDPIVLEYVNRVGQNLVRNSDAQVPFTIK